MTIHIDQIDQEMKARASSLPHIAGIVFDMDGLMFDTERLFLQVWNEAGKEWGLGDIFAIGCKILGVSAADSHAVLRSAFPPDVDSEAFLQFFRKKHNEYKATHPTPVKPGLYDLLEYASKKGYRMAVASSTEKRLVSQYLEETKVSGYFEALICGDMVEHSKPDPQIYQLACEALRLPPEQCLALEDSHNGIRSADRAGLWPVMIPDVLPPLEELRPLLFRCLPSLCDVISLLEELPGPI